MPVDLTKSLQDQAAAATTELVSLDHLQVGLRGGFERPAHWTLAGAVDRGWHDDVWDL